MFVGHYGVSFAARAADPSLPLSALMIATQALDVVWSILIILRIEKLRLQRNFTATNDLDLYYMPYSHGLATSLGWSVLVGSATYLLLPGQTVAGGVLMAAVCFSHWLLDLLVHTRDLPLIGDRYKVGFGLWRYRGATLAAELGLLFVGAALYLTSLPVSAVGLWWLGLSLTATLAGLHISTLFGPPPKSAPALAASALVVYVAVAGICAAGELFLTIAP